MIDQNFAAYHIFISIRNNHFNIHFDVKALKSVSKYVHTKWWNSKMHKQKVFSSKLISLLKVTR